MKTPDSASTQPMRPSSPSFWPWRAAWIRLGGDPEAFAARLGLGPLVPRFSRAVAEQIAKSLTADCLAMGSDEWALLSFHGEELILEHWAQPAGGAEARVVGAEAVERAHDGYYLIGAGRWAWTEAPSLGKLHPEAHGTLASLQPREEGREFSRVDVAWYEHPLMIAAKDALVRRGIPADVEAGPSPGMIVLEAHLGDGTFITVFPGADDNWWPSSHNPGWTFTGWHVLHLDPDDGDSRPLAEYTGPVDEGDPDFDDPEAMASAVTTLLADYTARTGPTD